MFTIAACPVRGRVTTTAPAWIVAAAETRQAGSLKCESREPARRGSLFGRERARSLPNASLPAAGTCGNVPLPWLLYRRPGSTGCLTMGDPVQGGSRGCELGAIGGALVAANDGVVPLARAIQDDDDAVTIRNAELAERSLVYVTLTRAKRGATITANGTPSRMLPEVKA